MKNNKSNKDKIRLGNQRNFDLLYDTLLSGGTYSDYRSELLDRSMPQEMPLEITEDDILAAWILGKDEESELYARGGHIHQDQPWMLNPNNKGIGLLQKDLNQNSFTSGASESDYTPTGLYSSDSGHNYTAGIPYVQQFDSLGGLGFNVAANANGASSDPYAKFIMGDTSGGFLQQMMSQKSSLKEGANYIKSLELNFGVGDNAYLAQQYNQMQPIARSTMNTDEIDRWTWFFDPSGIMHSWGLIDYDASEGQDYLNLIAEQVENRNKQNFNTAVTNSNKLNLWNQLSQPYMAACGGKMKNKLASGGYINSHYDYITDPLVKVDAGGTHQENPNEGVLTSIAPDGEPNLVEEGETIINNGQDDAYVFSDRIVADEEILKSHLLPNKFAGKTYADISKELDKIIEEHKNDEISKRTFDEMISRLQQALEDQKYQEKAEEVAKFIDGLSDEEKEQLEQTMVEEAQAEQQVAEEQAIAEQQAQELAALEQQMQPEQVPEQVVMEQPEEQIVPSRYDQMMSRALYADAANQGMFSLGGHVNLDGKKMRHGYPVGREPIHGKWNGFYDALFKGKPLVEQYEEEQPDWGSDYFIGSSLLTPNPNVSFENKGRIGIGNYTSDTTGQRLAYYPVKGNEYTFRQSLLDSNTGRYYGKDRKLNPSSSLQGKIERTYLRPYNYISDIDGEIYDVRDLHTTGQMYDNGRIILEDPNYKVSSTPVINENDVNSNTSSNSRNGQPKVKQNTKSGSGLKNGSNNSNTAPITQTSQEPYLNPHRPDYSIFGQYIPGLTQYEVDGNLLGYTDPFGRFVPIGGYSDYGDAVNSIADEINTSNTNTSSPNTSSKAGSDEDKPNSDNTTTDWSTYLRYAPAIGSGIQYLSDLFGVTNRNDYTNPNLFQRSINLIPNVGFTPLGGYRTFNPFDETYQQNALRSMNEAARRAVINNANGNYGAALAALNAINYNTSGQFGDLALKAREYNDKERQAIDEYNLRINQINASLSMNAQEKNQAIAALKARLTAALAEMRQQIEDTKDAAKSANMTNFYQNLGNVGKENFNMTMVRSNPAFYYTITDDGHILYKNGFDGLNERDQTFVRSVAEPQAEEQRKKRLEEVNNKADEAMSPNRYTGLYNTYLGSPYGIGLGFGFRGLNR